MNTVYEAFRQAVERHAERPFLHVLDETAKLYGIEAGTLGYRQAETEVERLREIYRKAGFGFSHRAGLLLENRPAFFLHWIALNGLGVSVVPINSEMRAAELNYLIEHSEISLAVTLAEREQDLRDAAECVGAKLVTTTPERVESVARAPSPAVDGIANRDTECALLYTSGTTGRPKGCILPNQYFLQAGEWYNRIGGLCAIRPGEERLITPLPLVHMNAMAYSTMAMIMSGGCIVQLDRFHPRTWWDSVRSSGATIVHYLGVMPAMLLGAAQSPQDRMHKVKFGFGAGVDRTLHAAFESRFGFPLIEAWAMSETGAGAVVIANREPRHVGTSCFGKPEPEVLCRLLDDEGNDVPPGMPGELLVRAAGEDPRKGFFAGYLKDPEATLEAWRGGYFHTGDIVRRDEAGYLYFVDRKKNVIRRSGENISAVEVESVLQHHPLVSAVGVAATPDPVRGDEVIACVVLKQPLADDKMKEVATDIASYCLTQLAYYKAPGYVAFVDALPLTTTQKIQRGQLKDLARDLPGTWRCVDTRDLKKRQG